MRTAPGMLTMGLAAAALVAAPAAAQSLDTRTTMFTLGAGVSFPQGDALDDTNTGVAVIGGLTFRPATLPATFRLEAMYTRFGFDEVTISDPEGSLSFDGSVGIVAGTINAIVGPAASPSGLRPYVIGGVGVYNVNQDFDIEFSGGEGGGAISGSEDETAFGLNGGAGLDFPLGRLRGFIEARYHFVFTDFPDLETGEDGGRRASFVPVVFGLRF